MQTINFSFDWNKKLNSNYFTTLRLTDRYYVGETVRISLKDDFLFFGIIVRKKQLMINNINPFVAGLDTGYSVDECKNILKKMYPKVSWTTQALTLYLLCRKKAEQLELNLEKSKE